jgi:hypothetical protein
VLPVMTQRWLQCVRRRACLLMCHHAPPHACMQHGHEIAAWYPRTYSYDFSYHLRFGKLSAMLTTTGHTVGSVAVCMLKYRVKTTETDKRHVVLFSNVRFSKVPMDFGFHDDLHAERHWYSCTHLVQLREASGERGLYTCCWHNILDKTLCK